ncbi:MAG: ApaG protein [Myxococcota bacterium]
MNAEEYNGGSSEVLTEDVRVTVKSQYLPQRSNPLRRQFLFMYEVTIANEGEEAVRLVTRQWTINHAFGEQDEIEGVGVVGERPVIAPGESHTYQSFCPLKTEFGTMEGSYGMVRPGGGTFRAEVGRFVLTVPSAIN